MSLSSLPPLLLFPPSLSSLLPRLRAAGIFIYFASLYQRTMIFVDLTPTSSIYEDQSAPTPRHSSQARPLSDVGSGGASQPRKGEQLAAAKADEAQQS